MKYQYWSIDRVSSIDIQFRYPSNILVFRSNADTEPILSITSGNTVGIGIDTHINNPAKDTSRYYKIGNFVLGIEMSTLKETSTISLVFSISRNDCLIANLQ